MTEEPHSFGSTIPFFKPLFSVAGIAPGPGTLEIRAFDANHTQLASASIPNLSVATPPPPVAIATQRFNSAVSAFRNALAQVPEVTSAAFSREPRRCIELQNGLDDQLSITLVGGRISILT